jgi:hypothetical protein
MTPENEARGKLLQHYRAQARGCQERLERLRERLADASNRAEKADVLSEMSRLSASIRENEAKAERIFAAMTGPDRS